MQHFYLSGKNEMRTIKYELCNFGNSAEELNAVIFALIDVAQYKDNSKIQIHNLKF